MAGGRGVPERAAAVLAVANVIQGRNLDQSLSEATETLSSDRARARCRALAFGAVRWHQRHRRLLQRLLDRPLRPRDVTLAALLSVGLFQLESAARPDYAVVSATVDTARALGLKKAAGLVNAVMRRFLREQAELLESIEGDAEAAWSHPGWLVESLRDQWPDHWKSILQANQAQAPMWVRVNRRFQDRRAWLEASPGSTLESADSPAWAPDAVALPQPVPVSELQGFAAGRVSVQDVAAQLAVECVAPEPGMRILDACAAPGGKTAHILERQTRLEALIAVDVDEQRVETLRSGLRRLHLQAQVICADATRTETWWDEEPFDRILVDAPCSGTGVIRRHPDIKLLRRPGDLGDLTAMQMNLLNALWPLLKPGGRLVYVTCSVLRQENHRLVQQFLEENPEAELTTDLSLQQVAAASDPGPGVQILPGTAGADGFYYALINKPAPG